MFCRQLNNSHFEVIIYCALYKEKEKEEKGNLDIFGIHFVLVSVIYFS